MWKQNFFTRQTSENKIPKRIRKELPYHTELKSYYAVFRQKGEKERWKKREGQRRDDSGLIVNDRSRVVVSSTKGNNNPFWKMWSSSPGRREAARGRAAEGWRTESNRFELLCSGVYCVCRTIADTVKTTVMELIDARNWGFATWAGGVCVSSRRGCCFHFVPPREHVCPIVGRHPSWRIEIKGDSGWIALKTERIDA